MIVLFAHSLLQQPVMLAISWRDLPAFNAGLNATATMLLVIAWVMIRRGRERTHRNLMLTAFSISILFLVSYLTYHYQLKAATGASGVKFQGPSPVREMYLVMLLTHVVLAAAVPVLAVASIWLGLKDRRVAHRKLSKWTLPIWLYVSVTGVLIYVMLYHVYGPPELPALNEPASVSVSTTFKRPLTANAFIACHAPGIADAEIS